MIETQEIALVEGIASGDSQAENDLFTRYGEQIDYMVRIRLKTKVPLEDQQDLASEVREALLLSLRKDRYDPSTGKSLGAYIAGIVCNIVGQYFRRKKKEEIIEHGLPADMPGNRGNPLGELLDEERGRKLKKCLSQVKPKYKEILLLKFYEKLTVGEIAQKLKLERRRVSERIHYAIKKLTEECKKENYFSIFICYLPIYL